jgi:mannose-6-phosphate isomerase-like protein (cupin superfamily)
MLTEDQSVLIPYGQKYRLENVGQNPLEIIEVQVGSHLREDDIVWLEDGQGSD